MIPSSTAVFTAAAASLLLGPALAISSSHPDPDITHNLKTDGPVQWPQAQDATAPAGYQVSHETDENEDEGAGGASAVAVLKSPLMRPSDSGVPASESMPLGGGSELERQPELRRSEDGRAVLMRRETSAAPTIYGVSIWLIIAWLGLLYLMYKTGSMF